MGEGSRMVRRLPLGCRERLRHKANTKGMQRGPSEASGLQRILFVLDGKPFEDILAQPSLEAGQPVEVSQVVTHLID